MLRSLLTTTGILGSALLTLAATRSVGQAAYAAADTYDPAYVVPPPRWLPLLSLGHREAMADVIWCRALIYQGEDIRHGGGVDKAFEYAEAMLALDPDFRAVYVWISSAAIYSPQDVTREDMDRTIDFLERARAHFPRDGQLAWLLGATLTFEAPPYVPVDEQEALRLRGLEHLIDASRLGAAPEWLVLSNSSMLDNLGSATRAIEHLEEMYAVVSDEHVRQRILERIESVRSEAYGDAFARVNDDIEGERRREFPYLAPEMYLLIRPTADEASALDDHGYGATVLADAPGVLDQATGP